MSNKEFHIEGLITFVLPLLALLLIILFGG